MPHTNEKYQIQPLVVAFANTVTYSGTSGTDGLNLTNRVALPLDVRKGCAFPQFISDVLGLCPSDPGGAPK
jgi:hypothetical protein